MTEADLICPKCKAKLRERTYEEIISEIMNKSKCSRIQAVLVFPVCTGMGPEWWCVACSCRFSVYDVFPQCISVRPLDGEAEEVIQQTPK